MHALLHQQRTTTHFWRRYAIYRACRGGAASAGRGPGRPCSVGAARGRSVRRGRIARPGGGRRQTIVACGSEAHARDRSAAPVARSGPAWRARSCGQGALRRAGRSAAGVRRGPAASAPTQTPIVRARSRRVTRVRHSLHHHRPHPDRADEGAQVLTIARAGGAEGVRRLAIAGAGRRARRDRRRHRRCRRIPGGAYRYRSAGAW